MIKWRLLTTVGALIAFLGLTAQDDPQAKVNYPEDLREDFSIIRQTFEQAHPDPYRYLSKAELDRLFDAVAASFTGPLTGEGYIAATLPVFTAVGDAGTLLAPPAPLAEAYEHTVPLIPFTVAVIGGRLYLDEELKGFRSLPSGCELLRINGLSATDLLAKMRSAQVAEGADTTLLDRSIERDFPVLYRRYVEPAEKFDITFRAGDGTTGEKELFGLTKDEMRQTHTPKGYDLQPWRMEELPGIRAAWLTLGTMDKSELERQRITPERFLNNAMEALRKEDVSTLVVDVRGAGGNDLGLAEQVFAMIAQAPYRVVKSISIRSGRVPDSYRYAAPAPDFFASVGAMYLPELKGRRELKPDDPRLMLVQPVSNAFQGKVYVVCDGLTTGAGAAFVMLANRSGRARTVGEETGSNASSFCSGEVLEVTLPRSGCILHVPLKRYVPEGTPDGPMDRGEMPKYKVPQRPEDLPQGTDSVREALVHLITEMQ
ncbi:MAG: hypothetical protein IPL81_12935 [Flavobacteriales bacterium]|jgi:hypothetical protein|nr:hypothetical protein [Flavobacteriales bacterium]MBK7246540.1 hypothetical protein [Flavobacteriales bacterium]MBK9060719.1 hypothetical protein [Flavobacteriales bacterium]QQS72218.1 MAG: hypothetical protein IPP95_13760 [Flavobacteriales bacterium]HQV37798.1 S41 family peptidase [Flavobacteriales bacterium]